MGSRKKEILSNVTQRYLKKYYRILKDMEQKMDRYKERVKNEESISEMFIAQMIPHHEAAIKMSENLLKYTTNIQLQNMALDIVKSQSMSIDAMLESLKSCSRVDNKEKELREYNKRYMKITSTMFKKMNDAKRENDLNCDFISEMIPHHRGAIAMAKNAISFGVCNELKPILENIIVSQSAGVDRMENIYNKICRSR